MATKIVRRDIRPHRAADGRLLGYFEDTYFVGDPPPATRPAKQLRTTQKATPARPPTPSPVAFLARHLGRVVTLEFCLACHQRHANCQCWPACNVHQLAAEAAEAAAPRERENTFSAVVRRQRANGILPGTPTPAGVKTGTGVPRENTFDAVLRLRRERGLM